MHRLDRWDWAVLISHGFAILYGVILLLLLLGALCGLVNHADVINH